jgi:ABC-2 type transport system ATP-binding protein
MRYGDKVAVDGLSLTVERGTITAVLGLDPVRDRRDLLPRIGVMLQGGGAWSGVRAMEMLDHIARLHSDPLDTGMLAERLGLGDCGRTPYRRLSGGQQQRLGLAMAIVGRPEIVFVDEPTAGMDPQARRTTWELLEELRGDGVTVVLTTHYMDEAERLADQIHIIDHGRLIASGTPLELTRGGHAATIRLVVTKPFPADAPESLTLGQRTLEEVFLELTGRQLEPIPRKTRS